MSHAVAILGTMILSFLWCCQLEADVRKDNVKAGYIIIDKTAYKLVKVEAASAP